MIQVIGFIITAIIFFTYLGVGLADALAAGGFTGLVLGLASQTVLSNIFGGMAILASKPFKIGDRVTISTWQYGLAIPSYPPKFWSNDFIIPGYSGRIIEISLMYTTMITDEGINLKIPNNIMIQAAIFVHGVNEARIVRTKYEIPKTLKPDQVFQALYDNLKDIEFFTSKPEIRILDTTLNTYIIVIEAFCKGEYEEPPRSEIIKITMNTVNELLKNNKD